MTDEGQQNNRAAGLQPQHQRSTISPRQRSPIGGLVQDLEQAVGNWKQSLSPRGAGTPDKLATPLTRLDLSQKSPSLGVRVASPRSGKEHVSLVTDAVLNKRFEQLTQTMYAHMARVIREEITSFDSTLQGSFDALEARCEGLEKKCGGHAQELERHEHDHRALADRVDGLQRQSAEQDQRVAQRLDQLGHTGGQTLDNSLRLLGTRVDKMSQDHQESVGALELANQKMVTRLETLQEQASMLHDSHKAQEQEFKALGSLRLLGTRVDKMSQHHQESVGALELANQQIVARLETLQEQASILHDSHKAQEQEFKALGSLQLLGTRVDKMSQDHQESVAALELANQQMVLRLETLLKQASILHDSHKAQEQEFKAPDSLRLLGTRVDKMSQDHQETLGWLELANKQMVVRLETLQEQASMLHDSHKAQEQECKDLQRQVKDISSQVHEASEQDARLARHVDTELQRFEGMLNGPAPSVKSDLMNFFQEMEDFKDKLHFLSHAQIQDRDAAPNVFDPPGPGIGAVTIVEPPAPEEASEDDCRWEVQLRDLKIENAASKPPEHKEQPPQVICGDPPPLAGGSLTARLESKRAEVSGDSEPRSSPQPASHRLAELQRKMTGYMASTS